MGSDWVMEQVRRWQPVLSSPGLAPSLLLDPYRLSSGAGSAPHQRADLRHLYKLFMSLFPLSCKKVTALTL